MTSLEQADSDLDAYILGDLEFDPEAEPLDLGDIDAADRALRRVSRIEHDISRMELLARARKEQIDEWLSETTDPMLRERDWFARSVEGWARAHLAGQKSQTVKLPSGSVSLRKTPPKLESLGQPDDSTPDQFVRVTRAFDKPAVKQATSPGPEVEYDAPDGFTAHAAVDANGEQVDGVVYLVRQEPSCAIKAGHGDE